MTYGVPYSFVPGTKAKADEVNANFIDVLNKIETSNSRITTLESDKADDIDIDGKWTFSTRTIADNVSINGSSNLVLSLSSYLPSDNNIYEVLISAIGSSSSTSGQSNICYLTTDLISDQICVFRAIPRSNSSILSGGCATLPIGTGRKISLVRTSNYYGNISITLLAYRKVR